MSKLLIDVGNTRLKWVLYTDEWLQQHAAAGSNQTENWLFGLQQLQYGIAEDVSALSVGVSDRLADVTEIVIAAVGAETLVQAIKDWANTHDLPIESLRTPPVGGGIVSAYQQPTAWGVDRWLALIGARRLVAGNIMVVDCGTAITMDIVDAHGRHHGGLIAPGVQLMQRSLLQSTAHIAAAVSATAESNTDSICARDTLAAVQSGAMQSAVGLLERLGRPECWVQSEPVNGLNQELTQNLVANVEHYFLTGGDAGVLYANIADNQRWVKRDNLVLEGMLALQSC